MPYDDVPGGQVLSCSFAIISFGPGLLFGFHLHVASLLVQLRMLLAGGGSWSEVPCLP